jgi:hypothetical protein
MDSHHTGRPLCGQGREDTALRSLLYGNYLILYTIDAATKRDAA